MFSDPKDSPRLVFTVFSVHLPFLLSYLELVITTVPPSVPSGVGHRSATCQLLRANLCLRGRVAAGYAATITVLFYADELSAITFFLISFSELETDVTDFFTFLFKFDGFVL